MKALPFLFCLLLLSTARGQLETKHWFLNSNHTAVTPAGVTTGLPLPPNNNFPVSFRSTSLSDASGNLLLAFNGNKIIDRNLNVMPAMTNVDLFVGDSKMLIQPVPNSTRYYVFYAKRNGVPNFVNSSWTLKYALVDLSLNGGNGDVVSYDQVVDTLCSPAFTLVQGDDPSKAWLVTHRWATDSFFVYPVTNAGLSNTPVKSRAGTSTATEEYIFRDFKTSYNGKMFAGIAYRDYSIFFSNTWWIVEVFNFNATTGAVTGKVRTPRQSSYFYNYFSLEFSPDNRLLYEAKVARIFGLQPCGFGFGVVRQYNLCYTDSLDFYKYSAVVAKDLQICLPSVTWGNVQMGADKRIHMPYTGTNVSTLNFPNRIGTYSTLLFNSYNLPLPNGAAVATPDFHHKPMEKAIKNNIVYEGGCHPNPLTVKITNDTINNIQWNFGDPVSGNNTSNLVAPQHIFSAPGFYTVTAQLFNTQNALIETVTELVEIKDPGKRLLYGYPTDTSFCSGGYLDIRLQVVNGVFHWSQLFPNGQLIEYETSDSMRIDGTGTWYVEMRQNDCNGCIMRDSIHVTVLPKPNFSLGPDRNLCSGDSILLQVFDADAKFLWNTGDTTNSIWVRQGGLYWVQGEYFNNGCPFRDSVLIIPVPGVSFSLPPDTILCNNQTLLLNPGVANASYLWQNGSTQTQFTVTQPGTYWVRIQSANGCSRSDTINVGYINAQQVNLGNDTSLCIGNSLLLNGGVANAQYTWNTGAVTQTITVTQTGTYWVQVVNGNCTVTDTIQVVFNQPPFLYLGNDTTLCPQQQLLLNPAISNAQYTWQDGTHTTTYTVTQPGTYWVSATRNGCTVRDTINVNYYNIPVINLGADTRFCTGDSMMLNAGPGFVNYLWSNGATTASTIVRAAGTYWVKGTTANGCVSSDTIQILSLYPLPVVNLGPDADICTGDNRTLNAGTGFTQYAWSNGSTASAITVNNTGSYSVTVWNQQGCKASDTIQIRSLLPLPQNFLPADTTICSYGTLTLMPLQNFNNYLWNNGTTNPSVTISQPGTYWLEVKSNNQCVGRDTMLVVLKDCMKGFYIPSAFTPNGDGKNDVFLPLLFGNIQQYNFSIYNRWGQVVFQSAEPGKGWDGRVGGTRSNTNVYTWVCRYRLDNEKPMVKKGTVVLIR
jgi:gliding motility-associated-like protein